MQITNVTKKFRGYKLVGKAIADTTTMAELEAALGAKRVIALINTQWLAHEIADQFEDDLEKLALEAGHKPLMSENEKGKLVRNESSAKFLARVGFKVDIAYAQRILDRQAFPPPEKKGTTPKVDALLADCAAKIAAGTDKQLAKLAKMLNGDAADHAKLAMLWAAQIRATQLPDDDEESEG